MADKKVFRVGDVEVRVRSAAGLSGATVKYLPVGQEIEADAASRVEKDGYVWWRHADGWSAERSTDGSEVFLMQVVGAPTQSKAKEEAPPPTRTSPPQRRRRPKRRAFRSGACPCGCAARPT